MDPGISFVKATVDDIPTLTAFRIMLLNDIAPIADTTALEKRISDYFSDTLIDNSYVCWMAKDGEKTVSLAGMIVHGHPPSVKFTNGRKGYLVGVYTLPEYRGKGLCTKLLHKLKETAIDMNIDALDLRATDIGKNIYKKFGFIEDEVFTLSLK